MARYSSESDSDYSSKYRKKHCRKSRSTSSDTSESSPYRRRSSKHSKKNRSRHRSHSRSRGRDRNTKSHKSGRSNSREREKHRYHSHTRRSHSSDRAKRKLRSTSREKSRSRSSSSHSNIKSVLPEKSHMPVTKDEFSIEPRFKEGVLEEINAEGFAPKQFSSSHSKENKFKNIVIDISADTIQIPTVTDISNSPESIFHPSIMLDRDARFDKWVKKLFTLRQKALIDVHTNVT